MYAVVNQLALGRPIDAALLQQLETDLYPKLRREADFVDLQIVRVSDAEAIIFVVFATREALDRISSSVAGPWFAANVRPYLAGPVQRSTGEVVSRALAHEGDQ
jgi:hypothetical protein